jgi:hypothetical protein
MNTFTENTFELLKIFHLSEFLDLSAREFTKVMEGYREGRYELVVIDEVA